MEENKEKNNKKKVIILAVLLLLSVTVVGGVGIYNLLSRATETNPYMEVKSGDENVEGIDYVKFDAYYLKDIDGDGYAEKLRGTAREVGTQDTLYMDLNVLTNGTLKNGKITINGRNFYFSTAIVKDSVISKDYIGTNTRELKLNDVTNGTQKLIMGTVQSGDYSSSYSNKTEAIGNDTTKYHVTDNTVVLTGTHVADDGTETEITKTVKLTNDWYGTTRATIDSNRQRYDINSAIDEENQKLNITFRVYTNEIDQKLILNKNHIEGELPLINGYAPTNLSASNANVALTYDEEARKFTAEMESVKNNNGVVTSTLSRNTTYTLTAEYPLQAYTELGEDAIAATIPVSTFYLGYNNTQPEYENPYKSNVASTVLSVIYRQPDPPGDVYVSPRVEVDLGTYNYSRGVYIISKELPLNLYNQVETENEKPDRYSVRWYISTGTQIDEKALTLKETPEKYTDKFLNTDNNYEDMLRYVNNVGIYFSNPQSMLGEDGYINVYDDETNELIHKFTKSDWTSYSSSKPYMYEAPLKHIRIETSNASKNSSLYVYNVKEIDDVLLTAEYEKVDYDKLCKIYSYVTGYTNNEDGTKNKIRDNLNSANYEAPYSSARIAIDPNHITNQETKKNVKLKITTDTTGFNSKKWQNGEFLIKYPEEIVDININSIVPTDKNITITAVDTFEENGTLYTKIYTSNDVEKALELNIDVDITADPRIATTTKTIEMYYYNPICHNYTSTKDDTYDVNGDGNKEEKVGYSSTSISLIAPSNLLTSQTATDFNDEKTEVIAPNIADIDKTVKVDKEDETRTAKVNINITNNYSNTISEVKIVGKIPYKGNTYLLNKNDLGSEYNTTMKQEGIVIPEDMKDYVTVYYSEKENVTEDITAKKNAWTTEPENMSKVKSFLIDLGDYVMPVNNVKVFTYTIQIPKGIPYNAITYSEHAVYYCLDTDQGKLRTQTEPNKLGFRIAEKYNLEITKYETNTQKAIQGVVFNVKDVETEVEKTATTNNEGKAILKNLYVEKEYILKEIKTNSNYVLDETETRIKGHIVDGKLEIEIIDETTNFKDTPQIEETENTNTKVKAVIENEVKYNFELNKIDVETSEPIKGIRFELTDYNGKARRYTTSKEGKLSIKLLEPNKQYTLTEVDSKGHYLKDPVTFMMVRDENNNLKFNVLAGELDALPVIDQTGEIPVVKTELTNEKIPTYSLKITKKEKDTENTLKGAQFKLTGENKLDTTLYTTDENGIIQIDNLYEYVEGKNVTGEYTLQEIYPSEGYVLDDTPIIFKAQRDATNNLIFELQNGKIRENLEDIQVDYTNPENPIINITVDNNPIFTLTKVDANTGEPLEGVGFEIRDINDNYVRDVNGELIGIKELGIINLYSTGNYAWTQNEDGTWRSGNYHVNSSTSTLTSEEFTVSEKGIISFDWSVSSQGTSYDYLYYTITNLNNSTTIGGTTTKIGGTPYGTEYNNLKYVEVEQEIEPGRYKIEFRYYKNYSTNSGLDRGFVKNILLRNKEKTVRTDNKGKIRLSLREGLYKAIETQPLEGYEKPELYTGIGIGASKAAKINNIDIENDFGKTTAGYFGMCSLNDGIVAVNRNGELVKYDYNGNIEWESKNSGYNYETAIEVEDGIIVVGSVSSLDGQAYIAKYDFDGNFIWEKIETTIFNYSDVLLLPDGIVCIEGINRWNNGIISAIHGRVVKYDFDGNLVWKNTDKVQYSYNSITKVSDGIVVASQDGKIVKYDFNGNFVCENTEKSYNYRDIISYQDSIIAVSNTGKLVRYDLNLEVTGENTEKNYEYRGITSIEDGIIAISYSGEVVKYDFEGNLIWEKKEKSYEHTDIVKYGNKIIAIAFRGDVIAYDFEGNLIWENIEKAHEYRKIAKTEDGYVIAENNGTVTKYDINGNILWINRERAKEYHYNDILIVEDGIIVIGNKYTEINSYKRNCVIVKYDDNGNMEWEKVEKIDLDRYYCGIAPIKDGIVVIGNFSTLYKYDFEGNEFRWGANSYTVSYYDVISVDDGIIAVGKHTGSSNGIITKFDLSGNVVWNKLIDGYTFNPVVKIDDGIIAACGSTMIKCNNDGDIIWNKQVKASISSMVVVNDGILSNNSKGQVTKYDFEGNLLWQNTEKTYQYNDIISTIDGLISISSDGHIVKYKNHIEEPEIPNNANIIVKNEYLKYKITTEVNGVGGTITGKDDNPYEEVIWKEDSKKEIVAKPFKGYKVKQITINGKPIDFTENADGTVTLDKFTYMTEDKNIVVSYINKNASLVIKKQDSINSTPLSNAIFNIRQIENRDEPISELIIKDIEANGKIYTEENITFGEKIENVLGELTKNGTYYFTKSGEKYVSNNVSKSSTTANSYIPIDLTDYEGEYQLVVNATISSESKYDWGYATITDSTSAPSYDSSEGQFMKISGTSTSNYIVSLECGKVYYLHLGYRKDGSGNTGNDKLTINSINLYSDIIREVINNTYNFIDNGNGGYESNNQGQANTVANSYIPIDLTKYHGKYNLIVNANVSSQSGNDYGYATVNTNTTAPTYSSSIGQFIKISGTSTNVIIPKDYSTVLEGGKMYYLHLGYYKNASTDSGEDKFTINSIRLTLNIDDFLKDTELITNSSGEALIVLENGKRYRINEIQAPEGYTLNSEPIIYDFVAGDENELIVTNTPQADVLVHHYIKGTTTQVAEDEYIKGDLGKEYSTSPKTDLTDYRVVTKEDGSYDLPENASGLFQEETQVVTYYYELKPLKLIVHHYIYETEDKLVDDEISEGVRGQEYTTNPITYPTLNEWYELVEEKRPENANGTLNELVTEVTYYYKLKEHKITTEVQGVGGKISGQNDDAYEKVPHESDSRKDIIVTPDEGYEVTQITVNGELITFTPDKEGKVILNKFLTMIEDKHIVVTFDVKHIDYVVTKVWKDEDNNLRKRPESIKLELYGNGSFVTSKVVSIKDRQDDNIWVTTFENLPTMNNELEKMQYTIVEKEVNENDLILYASKIEYNKNVTEAIITNTFSIPDTRIDVVATKKWEDNSNENNLRPSQVKLLLKNGDTIIQEQVIDTTSSDEQTYTFTDLREYDEQGNEIVYTIDEVEVNEGDLKFYSKTIDNENHIVTNTFTVPEDKISLEVTKIWQDNNNENHVRPSKLKLQVKNGDTVVQEQIVDVTEPNEQKYIFEDLMKYNSQGQEIEYTVDEAEVNEKDLAGYTKSVEGNVITNTINTYKITTQVNGVGGNITGKEDNPYESVVHGANSIKDITITPEESYEISKITINEVEQTLPDIKDQEYTLPKFTNMTEDKHIVVELKKKEYKITTEVEGIGGTISGQEDEVYETVIHGENSVKDIIVTPNKGYKITSITVNGEELTFTALEDGTYTLDKFNVVTENKHIVVKFESKETSIVIKHVTEEGTNLCDPETVEGVVGDEYETSSKEFEEYELKITPDNAEGVMKEEQIEIVYVYSLVKGKITITKVDNKDNSIKLSGAKFKIEKLDKAGNVDVAFTALEKETNNEGIIELNDLRVGTYEITEIEAPEGYELSKKAEKVEITKLNKEISITIKNKEKLELPVTGAINYAIGISIIGLAIVAISIILHKRKSV